MSDIATADSKNLTYTKIINHYLDEATLPGRNNLPDEQWAGTETFSDAKFKN